MSYGRNCANKRYRRATAEELAKNINFVIPYLQEMLRFEHFHPGLAYMLVGRWKKAKLTYEQKLGRIRLLTYEQ